jgi:hypothetical protein
VYNFDNIKITSYQELLEYVSEEDILTHYYGPWEPNVHSLCPFKREIVPSFYPTYYNQKLKWMRFGLYNKPMDALDLVMIKHGLSYPDALNKIYEDIVLKGLERLPKEQISKLRSSVPDQAQMSIVIDDWRDYDYDYWERYDGFTIKRLEERFKINAASEYWSQGIRQHLSKPGDPMYCYDHSAEVGHCSFTVYRPFADLENNKMLRSKKMRDVSCKFRKFMIRDHIMNMNTLIELKKNGHQSKHDTVFLTSALKDIAAFDVIGYDAIAAHTEEGIIPRSILLELKQYYKHIYVGYNNDETGVRQSLKITNNNADLELKYWNVPKTISDSKDPSDILWYHNKSLLDEVVSEKLRRDKVF